VGDVAYEVNALTNGAAAIGEVGDLAEALALLNEALDKASGAGDRMGHTVARVNLGCYLLEEGRLEEAREHLEEGVRMGRRLGRRMMEGCAQGELARVFLALGAAESAQARLTEAIALLERVSHWHVLRYTAYRAAAYATLGRHQAARGQFTAVEEAPEVRNEGVLRELVSLLWASVDLAVAREASPGSEEARGATEALSRRLARARSAPAEAASTDLRASLRWLERCGAAR
jgi:tetratricopeptide (TPR) repeat protein